MDNLLFDESHGLALHLDYASAFHEPLWRRLWAGHRLLGYLYRRLFLDPLVKLDAITDTAPTAVQQAFLQGVMDEHMRIRTLPRAVIREVAPVLRRPYLSTGVVQVGRLPRVWPRAARLVERKYLSGIKRSLREPLAQNLRQGNHSLRPVA
ncbi:hypothetical protein M0534_11785 [Methylonatrum kenyense]|uniref:hypothetical protein n=1 Tax=Methylonatrum kenyense TaxID=455253 RepID=UPI0020C030B6|nr:hypothetical protein [Methylonatrum kenyense]MCK8516999.1 hypothetical protein [Methylonatrum kenyense]